MIGETREAEGEVDPDFRRHRAVARQERGGPSRRHPHEVLLPRHHRFEQDGPAIPLLPDGVEIEDGSPALLVECRREVALEHLGRARRVLDRQAHRRQLLQQFRVLRVKTRARKGLQDLARGSDIDLQIDRVGRGRRGVVGGARRRSRSGGRLPGPPRRTRRLPREAGEAPPVSPEDRLDRGIHVREAFQEGVRRFSREPLQRSRTGRDGNRADAERTAAGDVVDGVADDHDGLAREAAAGPGVRPLERDRGETGSGPANRSRRPRRGSTG